MNVKNRNDFISKNVVHTLNNLLQSGVYIFCKSYYDRLLDKIFDV